MAAAVRSGVPPLPREFPLPVELAAILRPPGGGGACAMPQFPADLLAERLPGQVIRNHPEQREIER